MLIKISFLLYYNADVLVDSEEAIRLLSKALKAYWAVENLSQIPLEDTMGGQQIQSMPHPMSAVVQEPRVIPTDESEPCALRPMVSRAALILGYMHLDGEGTKVDHGEACRMFKLSACFGSKEGESVLGW